MNDKYKKILVIIGVALIIVVGILLMYVFVFKSKIPSDMIGTWNCSVDSKSDNYTVKMVLNKNGTFLWAKYDDETQNYVDGNIVYEKLEKEFDTSGNTFYMLDLMGDNYYVNGQKQTEKYQGKYEMGIDKLGYELVLGSAATSRIYYCNKK